MKRPLRLAAILLAVLVMVVVAVPLFIDADRFRPLIESKLAEALNRDVKLGHLSLGIFSGSVTASDLSIADDPAFSAAPFLQAKSLRIGVEVWPLIASRKVHVTGLNIDQPAISLIQSPGQQWNFSSLGGKTAPKAKSSEAPANADVDLSVKLVKISGGRFALGKQGSRDAPLVLEDVNLELHDFSSASSFPFTLSGKAAKGGTFQLKGQAGPINAANAAASPFAVAVKLDQMDTGSGLVSLDGSAESDGKIASVKGQLKGEKLKLASNGSAAPRPVEFDFALEHDLRKGSGRLHKGNIRIGSAPASLTGTYVSGGDSTMFHVNLNGSKMPIPELAAMLPSMGVLLPRGSTLQGGTATVNLSLEGPVDHAVTMGSISLDNTRLAGFDLGRKMAVIQSLAGIKASPDTDIQTLNSKLRAGPEGIAAEDIHLIVPAIGNLMGSGTVSPSNALAFRMRATVHTSGILSQVSDRPIPFTIEGAAADPVFRPDLKGLVGEEVRGGAAKAATGLLKGLLGGKRQ